MNRVRASPGIHPFPGTVDHRKKRLMTNDQKDHPLHEVKATICAPCLDGIGKCCHTPGCVFIRHDTPCPASRGMTLRQLLVDVGSIDGVVTESPPALCVECGAPATHMHQLNLNPTVLTCEAHVGTWRGKVSQ